ncbi:MAG TPA: hypothetical protein VLI55_04410 [Bryobacteraceae bacterium]|nr:hypothetical protein [Bryobacteraceae bacterium]
MAASKIKKKSSGSKASPLPRQGAIPCLIIVVVVLILIALLLYFSVRTTG